jgi:hypothetical protein
MFIGEPVWWWAAKAEQAGNTSGVSKFLLLIGFLLFIMGFVVFSMESLVGNNSFLRNGLAGIMLIIFIYHLYLLWPYLRDTFNK